jgi:hypothetical protein
MSACRSCGAPLLWGLTLKFKSIPLNAQPDINGNVVMLGEPGERNPIVSVFRSADQARRAHPDRDRYMPHHATCPQGKEWRRP